MGHPSGNPSDRHCAFCGRLREEVHKLVAGPNVFICDRCVSVCKQLLVDERHAVPNPNGVAGGKPRELKARLDEWVVGQEHAKRLLAVAVYNHEKRIALRNRGSDVDLQKSNILLLGPPGTGKTHLARTLARILDVPFTIVDATPLTQAGYVGEDVESVIAKLLRAAENDVERAQSGIIYIDEIDKLARRPGHDRDVSGEGVQQGLLKILEGKKVHVRVGADKNGLGEPIEIDTSNILFIAGGAFHGLDEAMMHMNGRVLGGFRPSTTADEAAEQARVLPEHLHKFGFLPEFVGRFPVMVQLDALNEDELVHIMTRPRDALMRQYQKLFAMEGARLEATHDGLRALAREAMSRHTGARGLRAVIEELLLDTMFDLPSQSNSGDGGHYLIDEGAVVEGRPRQMTERSAA